jgi:hypothetical protein
MRRTWREPGVTDFAKEGTTEISAMVLEAIEYWIENGVTFRVVEIGAKNIETGEIVYEKHPRVEVVNVPMFLFTGAEWGWLREHEAEIIEYLKGQGPRAS